MDNVSDFVPVSQEYKQMGGQDYRQMGGQNRNKQNRRQGSNFGGGEGAKEHMKNLLKGQKCRGKDFCLDYNLKSDRGGPKCTDRGCRMAHNCAFVPRGESKACGGSHSKVDHFIVKKEK